MIGRSTIVEGGAIASNIVTLTDELTVGAKRVETEKYLVLLV